MAELLRYIRPRARYAVALPVASLLLLAAAIWLGLQAYGQQQAVLEAHQQADEMRAAAAAAPPPKLSRAEADMQKRWDALRTEREFSWAPLFKALERAGNEDIELLGFQPDKTNKTVLLRGEGRDTMAVLEFLERLAAQPALSEVHLTHQKNAPRGQLTVVGFEIKASLSP